MNNTLNNTTSYKAAVIAMIVVSACAVIASCLFGIANADSFIGKGASTLLTDLGKVVALAGVGMGVFNIVKGRMVMGIVVIFVAAILYVFCHNTELFQQFGNSIVQIFN